MPIHGGGCHDEGTIDRCPLCLVDGRGVAMIKALVTSDWYREDTGGILPCAVEPHLYCVRLDGSHRPQHPVLHPEFPIVLQKHDAVARRKAAPAVIRLVDDLAVGAVRPLPLPLTLTLTLPDVLPRLTCINDLIGFGQFATRLQRRSDRIIGGSYIDAPMRQRNA